MRWAFQFCPVNTRMIHVSLTPFGRQPVTAGLLAARALAAAPPALPGDNRTSLDKWALFNDLREARMVFGITDRDLGVLYALLTFLPAKSLAVEADLIVFPSNATLSDRAHGMAESTLRRHLAALVKAGLIWRHDSPNGKRYAARDRAGQTVCAFGFDLRPLLNRAGQITQAAEDARSLALTLRRLREALVVALRDAGKLLAYGRDTVAADWDALDARLLALRGALRRQMEAPLLDSLLDQATDLLNQITRTMASSSQEMIASAVQNGRHHTNSNQDSSDFEPCHEKGRADATDVPDPDTATPTLPLYLVRKACPDLEPYAKGTLTSWRDFVATVGYVRGMMGISATAWQEAQHVMGAETAAIAVAAILQRIGSISNPGGYLRSLSAKAASGGFSPGPMIMSLLNEQGRSGGKS